MSEKIRLTPLVKTALPDLDREDAERFCPKCGRKIPPDRRLCLFCENTGEIPRPKRPRKQKLMMICGIVALMLLLLLATDLYILRSGPVNDQLPAAGDQAAAGSGQVSAAGARLTPGPRGTDEMDQAASAGGQLPPSSAGTDANGEAPASAAPASPEPRGTTVPVIVID